MKKFIKQLGQHTFIFGLGNIIQGAISFLLLPLYLHYLRPSDYGVLALLDIIAMISAAIILQSIPTSLFRSYSFDYVDKTVEQQEAVGSAFLYLVLSSLLCFGLLIILAPQITALVFKESNPVSLVRLILLTGLFNVPANIPLVVMRAKLKSKTMVTISLARGLATIVLSIFFVAYLKMGIDGVVWGGLIPAAVMFAISPLLLKGEAIWRFSFSKIRKMIAFGWPLVPGFIGAWILTSADMYLLEHLSTTAEVGLYSLGYKFANILAVVFLTPFQIAWPAIFFPKAKEPDALDVFKRFTTYFMLIGCGMALCLVIGAEPLIRLMGPKEYWSAHTVIPVLALALLFGTGGLVEVMNVSLYVQDKTKFVPIIIAIGAVVTIILNLLLIPRYGMFGSAVAILIGSFMLAAMTYLVGMRYYHISIEYLRIIKILTVFTLLCGLNYMVRFDAVLPMLAYKTLILAAFPVLIYLGILTAEEKVALADVAQKLTLLGRGRPNGPQA